MADGARVSDLPQILKDPAGPARKAVGDAPVVPIALILTGAYLAWFGVRYWRDKTTRWPTDPVKDVLQGKGLPAPDHEQPVAADIAEGATAAAAAGQGGPQAAPVSSGPGAGSLSGDAIAADAEKYAGKVKYVWGGGSPVTGWDCSGMVNYVICHDLGADIPGYRGGTFNGRTHGPNVASWLASPLVRHLLAPADTPQAGDLIMWGPNEHMGIAISATRMISAEDPQQGTQESGISGFFPFAPVIGRLNATVQLAGGDAAQNQKIARLLTGPLGWSSGSEWDDLVKLWQRESGWSVTAKNPASGAYGIPQALPGSKMASAGKNWQTSAQVQIAWGLAYIKGRYGSPSAAWEHEQQFGWY